VLCRRLMQGFRQAASEKTASTKQGRQRQEKPEAIAHRWRDEQAATRGGRGREPQDREERTEEFSG